MEYLIFSLCSLVLILGYSCWRLWLSNQHTGITDWAFSLEKQLHEANQLLREQDNVIAQIGELFDHAGVDLERTSKTQQSDDLKKLGTILRALGRHPESAIELPKAQETLQFLGNRYGIEPPSGGLFSIRHSVRIAEEILQQVIAPISSPQST